MLVSAEPYRATLYQDSDGEHSLLFRCTALGSGVLEIDNHYVFSRKTNRRIFGRRRSCDLQVRVKRRSSVDEIVAATLKLSREKIGELSFCPPTRADGLVPASEGSLEASLFVDDQLFDTLMRVLLSGKRPTSLEFDVEREGVIRYGWEPDGSRMEWKTQSPSTVSSIDVTSVSMSCELLA